MKAKLIIAAIAAIFVANANATSSNGNDCVGHMACKTTTNSPSQSQSQSQSQSNNQSQQIGDVSTVQGMHDNSSQRIDNGDEVSVRYLNVNPVHVEAAPIITPSAGISRMVDTSCGPRMIVKDRSVDGVNNRTMGSERIDGIGYDQYVEPDYKTPYRHVQVLPNLVYLVGHRVIETSAVVTTSTSGGFALGLNNSHGAGGSGGFQSGGALQRLVTTIRLEECTAMTVDTRVKTAVKAKRRTQVRRVNTNTHQHVNQAQGQQVIINLSGHENAKAEVKQ